MIRSKYMNEELVIKEIVSLREDVETIKDTMSTKDDIRNLLAAQDEMMVILKRLDEERVFTYAMVKRIEERVDTIEKESGIQRQELNRVKLQLKIA